MNLMNTFSFMQLSNPQLKQISRELKIRQSIYVLTISKYKHATSICELFANLFMNYSKLNNYNLYTMLLPR